jgi:hypothetical protein
MVGSAAALVHVPWLVVRCKAFVLAALGNGVWCWYPAGSYTLCHER